MDAHIPHTPEMVSQSASSAVHPRILARPHMPALPIPRVLGTAGNLCDGSVSAASGVLPQVVHAHLGGHEGDHQDAPHGDGEGLQLQGCGGASEKHSTPWGGEHLWRSLYDNDH